MSKEEYIEAIKNIEIDKDREKEVSKLYGVELCDVLSKVITLADKVDFFGEERRALSYKEIVSSSELLGTGAVGEGIIPIIDSYECSYIVYLTKENKWAKFNTIDGVIYKKRDTLEELL